MSATRRFAALLVATPLFLCCLLCAACQSQAGDEAREADLTETWPVAGNVFVTQLDSSDLVAVDADTGKVVWRFRHVGIHRREDIELPRSRLVCEPLRTPAGLYYLVYSDYLVSLAPETSTVRWRFRLRLPMSRGMCPAVTPDSGLTMIVQRGRGITKMRSDGSVAWTYEFPDGAAAIAGPTVVAPSGDTLVRAADDVFSVNPEGRLNWKRPAFP